MKWMISEDKLGASQVDVINEISKINDKPIWIKGHAGSGKSVLLLHALKDYKTRNLNANVCIVVFTAALVDLLRTGLTQIPTLQNKNIPVYTIYEFKNRVDSGKKYNAIFCDEVQDLPLSFLNSLRLACTHLVIAGDAEQSIYDTVPIFDEKPATSREISSALEPQEKNLDVIYRLTKSVLQVLKNVFNSLLGGRINLNKEDTAIRFYEFETEEEELRFCWKEIKETNAHRPSDVSAILLWGHKAIINFVNEVLRIEGKMVWTVEKDNFGKTDYDALNYYLKKNNIPLMYIGNRFGSLTTADKENKIVLMTYHSAKGLDFDYVYMPLVSSDMYIHSNEKQLFLVALSRSKAELCISYSGRLYRGLKPFLSTLSPTKTVANASTSDEIDF